MLYLTHNVFSGNRMNAETVGKVTHFFCISAIFHKNNVIVILKNTKPQKNVWGKVKKVVAEGRS